MSFTISFAGITLNIVDLVFAGLMLLFGLIGLLRGYKKQCLDDTVTLLKILLIIVLSPVVVGIAKKYTIGFAQGIIDTVNGAVAGVAENFAFDLSGLGDKLFEIVLYIAAVIVLAIVLGILFAIIKWLLKKIPTKKGAMKAIDKILGFLFGIAITWTVLLCLGMFVGLFPIPYVGPLLSGSFFMQKNFVADWVPQLITWVSGLFAGVIA